MQMERDTKITGHIAIWQLRYHICRESGINFMIYSESLSLWTSSIVRNCTYLENTTYGKLDLFPSSGERREIPTLLAPLIEKSRIDAKV
jgi:hypothetical protein